MRLTLHHIEITLKYDQNKAVASFEFAQRFFLLYEVLCHPRAYAILQNLMVYAEVDH